MSLRRRILMICSVPVAWWPGVVRTQEPAFQRIGSEAGLSHNSVYAITEDAEGFLWIGTVDGLNLYDGYEFRVYRHEPGDSASLSNNQVNALHADASGELWVATADGLNRFDPRSASFRRYWLGQAQAPGASRAVHAVLRDDQGVLWAGADSGLYRYDAAGDRFERVFHRGDAAGAIPTHVVAVRAVAGGVWVLEGGIGAWRLTRFSGTQAVESHELPRQWRDQAFVHIAVTRAGAIWLSTDGPASIGGGRSTWPRLLNRYPTPAWAALERRDGSVWIGTSGGLRVFDPGSGTMTSHLLDSGEAGYVFNWVRALYEDRSGTLWVGTHGGVYRLDPHAKPFGHVPMDPSRTGAAGDGAVSAVFARQDTLWLGTFGGGINQIDRRTTRVTRLRHVPGDRSSLPNDIVWALHGGGKGDIWVGTGAGLSRFDPRAGRFEAHPLELPAGFPGQPRVTDIVAEGPMLWLATSLGVARYDPAGRSVRFFDSATPATWTASLIPESILVEDSSTVWIGLASGELRRLDPQSGAIERFVLLTEDGRPLASQAVWDIHRDADGTLWLATAAGLSRFDRATQAFRHFLHRDGLPGSVVYSILPDERGRLWLGTNRGVSRFDPTAPAGMAFRNFSTDDGLRHTEFNRHAAFIGADGEFLLGGMSGVTTFFPSRLGENPYAPPVVFTRIESASRSGVTTYNPRGLTRLSLSYRDDALSFELAALSYTNPEQNRYAHLLEGFDRDWVDAGTRRFVRYTNIPPGDYVLRVRGSNNDGVWNTEGAALELSVAPPYWETTWFRMLVLAAFGGALALAYRRRVARLLEVERLRLRIAGDLHDDVSSNLAGIAVASEMIQRSPALGDAERRQLARITDTARRMVGDLRDIVWLVDPGRDRLDDLLTRMRELAGALLPDVRVTFRAAGSLADDRLSIAFRRQVFLTYKEVLHNVARHARATAVTIGVTGDDGRLSVRVEDDGVGFDAGRDGNGFGLQSLRRRVQELDGEFRIESEPGRGTIVLISAPIT
jgi:signal transduction histidine kinase/ligand-binding sensor domain-containing protein